MTRSRSTVIAACALLAGLLPVGSPALAAPPDRPSHVPGERPAAAGPTSVKPVAGTYTNPLEPAIPGDGVVESCADPVVMRAVDDAYWYMYCTTDPLNDEDRDAEGDLVFHRIPMLRSTDLVDWTYLGDAFDELPAYAAPGAGLWAPELTYSEETGLYYLFFGVTDVADAVSPEPGCASDNAIGVATAQSLAGPWTYADELVVEPRRGGEGCNFFWTYDPDVLGDVVADESVFYYGSYYGGIFARPIAFTQDGVVVGDEVTQVAIANRYEGANVVERDGWYYLFVSATNCCNGPLTGYSVFVGRSESPYGPFVDREGNSFLSGRVGGTPVLTMNGNEWVGLGHNDVFQDAEGNWWTVYHAVDETDPYFEGAVGFTKRPVLLDPVDWVDGWPTVRGGHWASDERMPAPAAQDGQRSRYHARPQLDDVAGPLLRAYSDDFDGGLDAGWDWVREPEPELWEVEGGVLRMETTATDLYVDSNSAPVLLLDAPDRREWLVETKVRLDLPAEGCCFNYTQAGLVVYGNDDEYLKLTHVSIWETRQTEWAKEVAPEDAPDGFPRYGNTVVGTPGEWTWLRIVKEIAGPQDEAERGTEIYTAYTSQDGRTWVRGATWTHELGEDVQIGLVAMGGAGFTAEFDYVRTHRVHPGNLSWP